MPNNNKGKKVYLEVIRLFAIVLVLYCHTGEQGLHFYSVADGQFNYWLSIVLYPLSQTSVLLFFMITGACLLNRDEELGFFLRHRVLKMFIITAFAVLFQLYINHYNEPLIPFTADFFFRVLWSGGAITQQWYLYAYMELLLVMPFLRKMIKSMENDSLYIYLFVISILIKTISPVVAYNKEWASLALNVNMLLNPIFYSLMGYFIEHRSKTLFLKGRFIAILWVLVIPLGIWNANLNSRTYKTEGKPLFPEILCSVYCFVLFVTIRFLFQSIKNKWVERVLVFLGSGVFGVYIFEPQIRSLFYPVYDKLARVIPSYPALFIWLTTASLCGAAFFGMLKLSIGIVRKKIAFMIEQKKNK